MEKAALRGSPQRCRQSLQRLRALDLRRALDARTNASAHDTMAPPSTTMLRFLGSVSVFALLAAPAAAVPVAERRQLIESAAAGEIEFEAALRPVVNVISYEGVAGHTTFQLAVSSAPFRDLPLLRLPG